MELITYVYYPNLTTKLKLVIFFMQLVKLLRSQRYAERRTISTSSIPEPTKRQNAFSSLLSSDTGQGGGSGALFCDDVPGDEIIMC
jgi:hypothetical protein